MKNDKIIRWMVPLCEYGSADNKESSGFSAPRPLRSNGCLITVTWYLCCVMRLMSFHDHSPFSLLFAYGLVPGGGGGGGVNYPHRGTSIASFEVCFVLSRTSQWVEKIWPSNDAHHCTICCRYMIIFVHVFFTYTTSIVYFSEFQWSITEVYGNGNRYQSTYQTCVYLEKCSFLVANLIVSAQIARFMGPTLDPSWSFRPQMGPCWPHEPCYQHGSYFVRSWWR